MNKKLTFIEKKNSHKGYSRTFHMYVIFADNRMVLDQHYIKLQPRTYDPIFTQVTDV